MATLLLRLQGALQSWGTTSRFDERDTQLEPSKSGVIGLVCAALGRDRKEPVDDLAALRFGVRADREGTPVRDYQTATGVVNAEGKVKPDRTVISPRFYLADAVFLVGLESEEGSGLEEIQQALRAPVWPLALGRRSCPPSMPVFLPDGLRAEPLEEALRCFPLLAEGQMAGQCRVIIEDDVRGAIRFDNPLGPFSDRRFGPRFARQEMIYVPDSANP